jgi:hypothetical protein
LDEEEVKAVLGGEDAGNRKAAVDMSEEEKDMEDMDEAVVTKQVPLQALGSYIAGLYKEKFYIAQVEVEEPENDCPGFMVLKYTERPNQFVEGGKDRLNQQH